MPHNFSNNDQSYFLPQEISALFYKLQSQIAELGYREVYLFLKAAHDLFDEMYTIKHHKKLPRYK